MVAQPADFETLRTMVDRSCRHGKPRFELRRVSSPRGSDRSGKTCPQAIDERKVAGHFRSRRSQPTPFPSRRCLKLAQTSLA